MLAQEIEHEIVALPESEQLKLIDFVESLRIKYSLQRKILKKEVTWNENNDESNVSFQTEGQRILEILEENSLLGCIKNGDGTLSENYKEHLWGSE